MSWKFITVVLTTLLIPTFFVMAAPDPKIKPIQQLAGIETKPTVFKAATRNKPLVLLNTKAAAQYFSEEAIGMLKQQVDFDQQILLVFAWRGSGQDKLEFNVLESYPEQVVFRYKPGRTRDLRPHVSLYALRKNVKWRAGVGNGKPSTPVEEEYVRVEVGGKLNAEVAAIGGETTGIIITAGNITWELDLGRRADFLRLARSLHNKQVIVSGMLHKKKGVEISERWIVYVTSLRAASDSNGAGQANAYLSPEGQLLQTLTSRDAQSGFAGESGQLLTIEKDGTWRRQQFLNKSVREADLQGTLSEGHLKELASALAKYDLLGLPTRLGKPQGANPHTVTISFGKQHRGMILRAGVAVPKPDPNQSEKPEQRFAHLYHLLQRIMTPKSR